MHKHITAFHETAIYELKIKNQAINHSIRQHIQFELQILINSLLSCVCNPSEVHDVCMNMSMKLETGPLILIFQPSEN